MESIEEQIFEALVALRHRGVDDSSVLIEEPNTGKFIQFGTGPKLVMDVPCVGLTNQEADRASEFFREFGEHYPREYDAPDPKTKKTHHGATFEHDFGKDARGAAQAAIRFFGNVYQFAPGTVLVLKEL
jgi:hypothetical protein